MPSPARRVSRLRRFLPPSQGLSAREYARSAAGALLGIGVAVLLGWLGRHAHPGLPWLVAPIGASAILVFAMPTSPLAQPWPVLGGTVIPALIGITCSHWLAPPLVAAGVAVAVALGAMYALRCLHPPGGAMAMLAAFGVPGEAAYGHMFALEPVALNAIALLGTATLYHRACGRRYPSSSGERPEPARAHEGHRPQHAGMTREDLDAVLTEYNELFDISRDDLEEILGRTEAHAYQRRFGRLRCADIMSRNMVRVEPSTAVEEVRALLIRHRVQVLPVVNRHERIVGIVTQYDLLSLAQAGTPAGVVQRLRGLRRRAMGGHAGKTRVVVQIMNTRVQTVRADASVAEVVPLFAEQGLHHAPVVDPTGRLVGMLTQTDLVCTLYRSLAASAA